MGWQGRKCPLEQEVAEALRDAGIAYTRQDNGPTHIDFHLTDFGVYLEIKQFHTPRTAEQMARAPNVIAIQGAQSIAFMAGILRGSIMNSSGEAGG